MTDSQVKPLLKWLQGETLSIDNPITPFIKDLRQTWLTEQVRNKQKELFWVERITQLVLGELDETEAKETQAFLQVNPTYKRFYTQIAQLWALIEEADKLNPWQPIREWGENFMAGIQATAVQPALVWRGTEGADEPIRLSIPEQKLEILLFLGGIEPDKRYVQGDIMVEDDGVSWQDTRIWLLSEEQGKWYEAQVEEDGRFLFLRRNHETVTDIDPQQQALPVGSYTFEMAWNEDHHLEVHDVLIPKG